MSRIATGDTVVLKPVNNVYTALLSAATIAVLLGIIALWIRHAALFPEKNLFF